MDSSDSRFCRCVKGDATLLNGAKIFFAAVPPGLLTTRVNELLTPQFSPRPTGNLAKQTASARVAPGRTRRALT